MRGKAILLFFFFVLTASLYALRRVWVEETILATFYNIEGNKTNDDKPEEVANHVKEDLVLLLENKDMNVDENVEKKENENYKENEKYNINENEKENEKENDSESRDLKGVDVNQVRKEEIEEYIKSRKEIVSTLLSNLCLKSNSEENTNNPDIRKVLVRGKDPFVQEDLDSEKISIDSCPFSRGYLRCPSVAPMPICLYHSSEDIYVSATIKEGRLWDSEALHYMMSFLSGKPKGIIVDAGANVGQFSLCSAALGHTLYSFEPSSQTCSLLKKTVQINNSNPKRYYYLDINLFENALGDRVSESFISIPDENKGGSSIRNKREQIETISIVKMDHFLEEIEANHKGEEVWVLKMDIEGMESRMLMGSVNFIATKRPHLIMMELQPLFAVSSLCSIEKTVSALYDLNYRVKTQNRLLASKEDIKNWCMQTASHSTVDLILERGD